MGYYIATWNSGDPIHVYDDDFNAESTITPQWSGTTEPNAGLEILGGSILWMSFDRPSVIYKFAEGGASEGSVTTNRDDLNDMSVDGDNVWCGDWNTLDSAASLVNVTTGDTVQIITGPDPDDHVGTALRSGGVCLTADGLWIHDFNSPNNRFYLLDPSTGSQLDMQASTIDQVIGMTEHDNKLICITSVNGSTPGVFSFDPAAGTSTKLSDALVDGQAGISRSIEEPPPAVVPSAIPLRVFGRSSETYW